MTEGSNGKVKTADVLRDLLTAKVEFQLRTLELILGVPARRIEARSDETLQAAQPNGQEPDGEAMRPNAVTQHQSGDRHGR